MTFDETKVLDLIKSYSGSLSASFVELYSNSNFLKIISVIQECWENQNRVLVAGNGGSAAISSHIVTDWNKGLFLNKNKQFNCLDLTSNLPLLTASANDLGWENALSQIFLMNFSRGDIVLIISSSGESLNLINLAKTARGCGVNVIGLSGNGHSTLVKNCDFYLTTNSSDTQIIEDSHSVFGHLVYKICSLV
jgi:D-sedoheptulose 7-phosphate isomerase